MRIGAKKRPFYRVVVVEERSKRNGAYLELLGTYDPMTTPHDIKLKKDRIDHWLKMGAQKSDGFLRILGEAPKRPPRKPKKVKQEKQEEKANTEGEAVKVPADQSLSEQGETEQSAQAMTSTTLDEPVLTESRNASLTGEDTDSEPKGKEKNAGSA